MYRCFIVFLIGLALTGCSRFDLSDAATATGAVAGAAAGALTGSTAVTLITTAGGAVAGGAVVEDVKEDVVAGACAENPEVCNTINFWNAIKDFIHWIIGGAVVLTVAAWLIPGPQFLFRRKTDARTDSTDNRSRSTWRDS